MSAFRGNLPHGILQRSAPIMEFKKKLIWSLAVLAIVGLYFGHITMGILGDFGDGLQQGVLDVAQYLSELLLIDRWL